MDVLCTIFQLIKEILCHKKLSHFFHSCPTLDRNLTPYQYDKVRSGVPVIATMKLLTYLQSRTLIRILLKFNILQNI